jgi:nicotinamidase-related amidase
MESAPSELWESEWPWPALEFELEPASTALLVVDLQPQSVYTRDGTLAAIDQLWPGAADLRAERLRHVVLPNCHRLLDFFRDHQLRVIFLTIGPELSDHRDLSDVVRLRNAQRAALTGRPVVNHLGTPAHGVLPELAPRPTEPVVNKLCGGAFNSTNLDSLLRNLGVRSLVVVGVATNACVESTARGASDLGYEVVLVEDATACDDPFLQRQSLRTFASTFGRVQTTTGVLAELAGDDAISRREADAVATALLRPRPVPLEHLHNPLPFPPLTFDMDVDRTALLIVDMQYFCHPAHGMASAMESVQPGYTDYRRRRFLEVVLPNCQHLLNAFRAHGRQVVFLTIGPELADGSGVPGPMLRRNQQRARYAGRTVAFPVGTFEHGIVAELAPRASEPVVNKLTASAFMSSKLDQLLRNLGITGLVICGVATNACVESTARDAADRGYRCLLVDDACAAYDPAFHEATMRSFRNIFGRVVLTEAVTCELFGPAASIPELAAHR